MRAMQYARGMDRGAQTDTASERDKDRDCKEG